MGIDAQDLHHQRDDLGDPVHRMDDDSYFVLGVAGGERFVVGDHLAVEAGRTQHLVHFPGGLERQAVQEPRRSLEKEFSQFVFR